jgi:hypothetical protein
MLMNLVHGLDDLLEQKFFKHVVCLVWVIREAYSGEVEFICGAGWIYSYD